MATIRKRDDKWQAQIRVAGMKPFSKTFATKKAAQVWSRVQETLIDGNELKKLDAGKKVYLSVVIDKWVKMIIPTFEESGRQTYLYRATLIRKHFGMFQLHKLKPQKIVDYAVERLDDGLAPDSVQKELQVLDLVYKASDTLWKLCVPENPVKEAKNIIKQMRLFGASNERDRRLDDDELIRLMSVVHTNKTLIDYCVLFALETGLRRGELSRLTRLDIMRKKRFVRVRKSKSDWKTSSTGRDVPLSTTALQIIDELPMDTETLFNLKPDSITNAFERLCVKADIEDLRVHDLRHEAISRFFEKGFAVEEVASMSGHRSWASLKRYTHPKAEQLAERLG